MNSLHEQIARAVMDHWIEHGRPVNLLEISKRVTYKCDVHTIIVTLRNGVSEVDRTFTNVYSSFVPTREALRDEVLKSMMCMEDCNKRLRETLKQMEMMK